MKSRRTIVPILESTFDQQSWSDFAADSLKANQNRVIEVNGEVYTLNRITMPNGEIRKFASQYNGYGEPHPSESSRKIAMRFGCAWSPAGIVKGL